MDLEEKIERAIKIIRMPRRLVEVAYSGGKDSDVILELCKMANVPYRAIYKCTTIDPPGTIAHCKEMGVEIRRPAKSFFELIAQKGFPNRWRRFCCAELKEYKISDTVVVGVRRAESPQRAARYKSTDPIICRVYNKTDRASFVMPILEWTKEDVCEFVKLRKLKCHPLYYDEQGHFHPERRLGCLGCPLASKDKRLVDFTKYPNLVKAWVRAEAEYMRSHPNGKITRRFSSNPFSAFVCHLFFPDVPAFETAQKGLFGEEDCKSFLENYFKIHF